MNRFITYIRGSVDELLYKVTWPKMSSLQSSAILVLIASLVFALFIGLIDFIFSNTLKWFYQEF